jgi:DNA-directed RNA polymerase alpha subunit
MGLKRAPAEASDSPALMMRRTAAAEIDRVWNCLKRRERTTREKLTQRTQKELKAAEKTSFGSLCGSVSLLGVTQLAVSR